MSRNISRGSQFGNNGKKPFLGTSTSGTESDYQDWQSEKKKELELVEPGVLELELDTNSTSSSNSNGERRDETAHTGSIPQNENWYENRSAIDHLAEFVSDVIVSFWSTFWGLDKGYLQQDTINEIDRCRDEIKTRYVNQSDEKTLQEAIKTVLRENRQANEDLKQYYIHCLLEFKIIQEKLNNALAISRYNINLSGPVEGLVIGDYATVDQVFNCFPLQSKGEIE